MCPDCEEPATYVLCINVEIANLLIALTLLHEIDLSVSTWCMFVIIVDFTVMFCRVAHCLPVAMLAAYLQDMRLLPNRFPVLSLIALLSHGTEFLLRT